MRPPGRSEETPAGDAAPSTSDEDIVDAEVVDDEETKCDGEQEQKPSDSPGDPQNHDEHTEEPVVRDKRRIDPETGEVRQPESEGAAPASDAAADEPTAPTIVHGGGPRVPHRSGGRGDIADAVAAPEIQLAAERLADLQRVHGRVRELSQADRSATARSSASTPSPKSSRSCCRCSTTSTARTSTATSRATPAGPRRAEAARQLSSVRAHRGRAQGGPFDPNLHEAIFQQPTPGRQGRHGRRRRRDRLPAWVEKLLRPAKVAVDVPAQ